MPSRLEATRSVHEARLEKCTTHKKPLTEIIFHSFCQVEALFTFVDQSLYAKLKFTREFLLYVSWTPVYHVKKQKKIFPVSAWVGWQSLVWLYACLYIVKEGLCIFSEFDWTTANNCQPKFEKTKMANVTAAEFTKLNERVKVVMENLDQMFLLVMGCLIFCEYVFFVFVLFI